jgi:hypothetical protein
MAQARITTDHDEIRKWVEARGGQPAHVKGTEYRDDPGVLRIEYPGFRGSEKLEPLTWDDWFEAFDEHQLAFLYDPDPKSRFSKLVDRDELAKRRRAVAEKRGSAKRMGAKRTAAKRTAAKRPAAGRSASGGRTAAKRSTGRTTAKKASTARRTPRAAAARTSKRPTAKKRASTGPAKKRTTSKRRSASER